MNTIEGQSSRHHRILAGGTQASLKQGCDYYTRHPHKQLLKHNWHLVSQKYSLTVMLRLERYPP